MLFMLVPLTLVLALQDWRAQKVNLWIALLQLVLLITCVKSIYLSVATFGILFIYKNIRPSSIQLIDVAFFSVGAGFFELQFFPIYCFVTAGVLLILNKIKNPQLPFLVAWGIGFWVTLIYAKSY